MCQIPGKLYNLFYSYSLSYRAGADPYDERLGSANGVLRGARTRGGSEWTPLAQNLGVTYPQVHAQPQSEHLEGCSPHSPYALPWPWG